MTRLFALLLPFSLAACGAGGDKAERTADQLEEAADQSDPTSAAVLEDAADQVRKTGNTAALSDPNSPTQQALEKAAAINPTGVGSNVVTAAPATAAPPPKQAVPNRDGQQQPRPAVVPPNARD